MPWPSIRTFTRNGEPFDVDINPAELVLARLGLALDWSLTSGW